MIWDNKIDKLVSINILEFVTEIIKYSTLLVALSFNTSIINNKYTVLLNGIEKNNTTKFWTKKVATKYYKTRALQRLLCGLMVNRSLTLKDKLIVGVNNLITDKNSQLYLISTKSYPSPLFFRNSWCWLPINVTIRVEHYSQLPSQPRYRNDCQT